MGTNGTDLVQLLSSYRRRPVSTPPRNGKAAMWVPASAGTTIVRARLSPGSVTRVLRVNEQRVVEVGSGEFVLLGPVILGVLPFGLVAAFGQEVHAAQHVAGVEVLLVDPRVARHVVVFRPQRRGHLPRAFLLHVP